MNKLVNEKISGRAALCLISVTPGKHRQVVQASSSVADGECVNRPDCLFVSAIHVRLALISHYRNAGSVVSSVIVGRRKNRQLDRLFFVLTD
jgi:hypothetical protein